MTTILALIDGSVYGKSVTDHAAWAAERLGDPIELLHVLGRRSIADAPANYTGNLAADERDSLLQELAGLDAQQAKLAQKRGRLILQNAQQALQQAGLAAVSSKLRNGDLIETVEEFQANARMIIIGKRGEAADFAKLHLGSNVERVVRATNKPILIVSRAFKPAGRFLIAFDGSTSVMKAVKHIAQGQLFRGLPCDVLMAGAESDLARMKLDNAVTILREGGYTVTADIRPGEPEAVIAAAVEAEAIGALVMGAYGHSPVRSLIIGSTTTEMIRSCKVPVMIFR